MISRINQFTLLLGLTFILICSIRTISTPELWSHLAQAEQGTNSLGFRRRQLRMYPIFMIHF